MKKILTRTVAIAVALSMCLCFALAEEQSNVVTDMYDREIALSEPVTRIVALTAADCEILCALGCENLLVGRGEYCDYPASILSLPVVQSGANTNIEEIIALAPQLVLMSDMAQSKDVVDALEASGIHVAVSNAADIEGVYTNIGIIGALTGKTDEAEKLITSMKADFAEICASSANSEKTVYFEVSPLQWGLWTSGNHTFMNEIANMCGVKNVFEDVEGWSAISEEQVLERNPDYIVTNAIYYGEGPKPVEEIASRAGWENVTAVKNGAIFNADSDAVSRPGPRLVEAAKAFKQFIDQQ